MECVATVWRERRQAWNSEWHKRNAERRAAYDAEKRAAKLEEYRAKARERQKKNPAVALTHVRRREAAKINATPLWADCQQIKEIYQLATKISQTTGIKHHVDHIVPLRGKRVCGLHVPVNLQVIPAIENMKKGNRW